jgi:hypothetical protein
MNSTRWLIGATLLAATLCSGPLAFCAEGDAPKDQGWYIGGGIGAADDHDFDETEGGGKFFAGYRAGEYLPSKRQASMVHTDTARWASVTAVSSTSTAFPRRA